MVMVSSGTLRGGKTHILRGRKAKVMVSLNHVREKWENAHPESGRKSRSNALVSVNGEPQQVESSRPAKYNGH
jgi:hypothetical protein